MENSRMDSHFAHLTPCGEGPICYDRCPRIYSAYSAVVRPRAVLLKSEVISIFINYEVVRSATNMAKIYGVSEKTIRDIWTGRTWATVTCHLRKAYTQEYKDVGRPLGKRDAIRRKSRRKQTQNRGSALIEDTIDSTIDNHFLFQHTTVSDYAAEKAMPEKNNYQDLIQIPILDKSIDQQLLEWEDDQLLYTNDPFGEDWLISRNNLKRSDSGF